MDLPLAVGLSLGVALLGWGLRGLTPAGAGTAVLVGTGILWPTGWEGMAALGAFFFGASAISRVAPDKSVAAVDAKGHRRDPWQVLANGGSAALGALLEFLLPGSGIWIVTASLATAAADTWATSTGGWSRVAPRDVITGRPVPAGTSGGITWLGSLGALAGAASVAGAAILVHAPRVLFPAALTIGMLGMLADSVLGATLQGRFHCGACNRPTERRVHRCGQAATPVGGLAWLSNDGVNALATAGGAGLGLLAWHFFS
ncbi:MAG: DUF92 domain-containing protein [Gemmatimonadetes bacterium]|nr:DUF92 domain-containing protein [Gemmatimonadota bacterium]